LIGERVVVAARDVPAFRLLDDAVSRQPAALDLFGSSKVTTSPTDPDSARDRGGDRDEPRRPD